MGFIATKRNADHEHPKRVFVGGSLLPGRNVGQPVAICLSALLAVRWSRLDVRWWRGAACESRERDQWQ